MRILKIDEVSQDNIDDLKNMMQSGRKIDPPVLGFKDNILEYHDGRHRAIAAQQLGITSIPVLILEI